MAVSGIDESDRDMAIRIGNPEIINTPAPPSYTNANTTFTAADVIGGVIVQDGTGGVSIALPSAVNIAAAIPGTLRVGDTLERAAHSIPTRAAVRELFRLPIPSTSSSALRRSALSRLTPSIRNLRWRTIWRR
jgi:hypothetical protein